MRAAVITKQGSPVAPNIEVVGDWPEPVAGRGVASKSNCVLSRHA